MRTLSKTLNKIVTTNNTRKHFKILERDYILALRSTVTRGYNIKKLAKFNQVNFGYVSLYIGKNKSIFWSLIK